MTSLRGHRSPVAAVVGALVLGLAVLAVQPSAAAQTACTTTDRGSWSATLCLSASMAPTATGQVEVAATMEVSSTAPRVAKTEFSLGDTYHPEGVLVADVSDFES